MIVDESVRFGVGELIASGVTVASITACIILWAINYFQSKKAADEFKRDVNSRVTNVENTVQTNAVLMNKINTDVSYIRGRLEPK